MLKSICCASALLLASTLTPAAFAAHTHMPPHSAWTLNLGESNFGGGPSMKSDTFVILTDTEKWGKWTDTEIDAHGKTWKSSWSGPEDGRPHPFTGIPGIWSINPATDVSVMTSPDGSVQTCTSSLSSDKKKYSEKCVSKSPGGKETHQVLVWDRTK